MRYALLICFGALVCLSGCGGEPRTYAVNGRVTVNGKPLPAGDIYFHPSSPSAPGALGAASSGSYSLSAPAGKYKVTVSPPPDAPRTQSFHNKFADVNQTPLEIEVVPDDQGGCYDLNLTNR